VCKLIQYRTEGCNAPLCSVLNQLAQGRRVYLRRWAIALFFIFLSLPARAQPVPANESDCVEAERVARQTIQTSPDFPDPYLELGDALVCLQRPDDAIAIYQQAIEQFQADPDLLPWTIAAYFKLADVQVQQHQIEAALSTYRQAIERDPIYGFLVNVFSHRHYSPLGEPITDFGLRGYDAYGGAVRADSSTEASMYYELGQTLVIHNRLPEAITAYQQAIALSPTFAYAHLALGQVLYQANQPGEAIATYQEALRLNPDLVWGYYGLGQVYAQQGQTAEAIVQFRQVIGFHTGLDTLGEAVKENIAYSLLGDVQREQGNLEGAIAAYREAIARWPQDGFVRISLGRALREQGQEEEAISVLQDALASIPETAIRPRAVAYTELGQALAQQGQREEAIAAFQSALATDPDFTEAQEYLQQLAPPR